MRRRRRRRRWRRRCLMFVSQKNQGRAATTPNVLRGPNLSLLLYLINIIYNPYMNLGLTKDHKITSMRLCLILIPS
jgi:hypothetical protein